MTGKVKWFDAEKGFGFIECGDGKDVFVHYTAIKMEGFRDLIDGRDVEFELVHNELGPRAINVIQLKKKV